MRLPAIPLTTTTLIMIGGVLLLLFVAVAMMGRRSIGGAPGAKSVDDRLTQFAGRSDRSQPQQVKPLARLDAAVSKGRQGSKMARDLARADLKLTVGEFILIKIGAAAVGATSMVLTGPSIAVSPNRVHVCPRSGDDHSPQDSVPAKIRPSRA